MPARVPTGARLATGRSATDGDLPAWPFYLLFVGYPAWWLLGLGAFAVVICSVPMLLLMCLRGRIMMPRGFLLWLLFVGWAAAAVVEIDGALRVIGFGVRLSNYVGATVVFLYLFNAHRRLPTRSVLLAMSFFFAFVVVGGYLGVLFPGVRLNTPTQALLPAAITDNDYVRALVRPSFAEVQQPYGSPRTFSRPSAPFAYTNGWGCNVALLVPIVIAAVVSGGRRRWQVGLVALLLAALVPAIAALNRGMYIAVALALAYGAVRLAMRGRFAALVAVVVAAVAGIGFIVATGTLETLDERLYYSETNIGRTQIYQEAIRGTLESPLLGNGAPRPSETLVISIGTQGQVWNVMFSYGFPALALFLGWFLYAAWTSRRVASTSRLWLHVTLVVVLLTVVYYGYDGPQLTVAMVAAALVLRPGPPPEPAARPGPLASSTEVRRRVLAP